MKKLTSKVLLFLARSLRNVSTPRFVKFLFFLVLRGRNIKAVSRLERSGASVSLNIGNYVDYVTFMDGCYDKGWMDKVKKVTNGKIFIDIGANIGIYPLSLFKDAEHIYAFEPELNNYKLLTRSLKINHISNVDVIRKAILSKNKRVKLFIDRNDNARHSVISKKRQFQEVQAIRLDSFIERNNIGNIGLVKIDVEGAEIDVLRGAERSIERLHFPVLVEVNNSIFGQSNYQPRDVSGFMKSYGYVGYRLIKNELKKLNENFVNKIRSENILFMHRNK